MQETAINSEYIKRVNRRQIVSLLRKTSMSRIELSKKTGLTRAAITLITRELIDDGILIEGETQERRQKGKAPTPLSVNPDACYAVGAFLTRVGCMVGVCDFSGHVLEQTTLNMKDPSELNLLVNTISDYIACYKNRNFAGVGISAPGPLDTENGAILNPPYFDAWQNTAIVPYLSTALGTDVYLEKDACVLALYHLETGDSRDFLLLLVDDGIGSGVVSDGHLLVSAGQYTSELGHTTIAYNGKPCGCGNRGCLEAYASVPNLICDHGPNYASWNEIIDACDTELLDCEADYLAAGIVNIRNLINIDTVYLAGYIKYGFNLLAPRLMQRISVRSMSKTPIRLLPSYHVSDIGVSAAANLAFSGFLEREI